MQTTTKAGHSQVIHEWRTLQEEFLHHLFTKTKRVLRFEETDYCHTLSDLGGYFDWLPSEETRVLLRNVTDKVFMDRKD